MPIDADNRSPKLQRIKPQPIPPKHRSTLSLAIQCNFKLEQGTISSHRLQEKLLSIGSRTQGDTLFMAKNDVTLMALIAKVQQVEVNQKWFTDYVIRQNVKFLISLIVSLNVERDHWDFLVFILFQNTRKN